MVSVQGQIYTERFWSYVDKSAGETECWPWTASLNWKGYGQFGIKGPPRKKFRAHRLAYWLSTGKRIPKRMQVDHTCHNRRCCNPRHLRLVTNKQNIENRKGAQANSQSGVRGVTRVRTGKYSAQLKHNGKKIHIGTFPTLEEAEKAVIAMRLEIFTHSDGR